MTCIVSVPGVFIVKIQKWNPQQTKGKGNKEKFYLEAYRNPILRSK